jgi:hypothetical protein
MNSIYALPEEDIQALEYYYDYFWVNPDKKTWYFLSQ